MLIKIHTLSGDGVSACSVDQSQLSSPEDSPVTNYYLWLPSLLTLTFLMSKSPQLLWKGYFDEGLITHIIAGNEDSAGERKIKIGTPREIAAQFIEYRKRFTSYHINFTVCEVLNVLVVLSSIQITHWLMNHKFWLYGLEVITYLHTYQEARAHNVTLHDPMCEVFPTEVSCTFSIGSPNGNSYEQTTLCILGNNMFNQKYFFALWIWWMFLLAVSVSGIFFRILGISCKSITKCLLQRKTNINQFKGVNLTSGDLFILIQIYENLKRPRMFDKITSHIHIYMLKSKQDEYGPLMV